MISLIRHLTPIPVGDILPLTTDISEGADLSRLKYYRNKISHSGTGILSETDFHQWWTDISEVIYVMRTEILNDHSVGPCFMY